MKRGWWALGVVGVLAACESTSVPKTDIPDSPDPTVDAGVDGAPLPPPSVTPKVAPIGKQTIVIGKSVTFRVTLERGSLAGPLEMTIAGLPTGVTAKSEPIAAEASAADVTLSATENVAFGTSKTSVQVGKDAALSAPFDLEVRGVPGTLDKSFGVEGAVVVGDDGRAVFFAVAPDGASVGQSVIGTVTKRTPSGALDTTFGAQGVTELADLIGGGNYGNVPAVPVLDAAGNVYAAYEYPAPGGTTTRRAFVTKLTPRGTPDPTFGSNGLCALPELPEGSSHRVRSVTLFADGSLVVAAQVRSGSGAADKLVLRRVTKSGTLDTAWGAAGDGTVAPEAPTDGFLLVQPTSAGGVYLAVHAGSLWQGQWTKDGRADPTFGLGQGYTSTPNFAPPRAARLFAKRRDGALDVGYNEGDTARTNRYTSTGIADTTYVSQPTQIPASSRSTAALVDSLGRTYFGFQQTDQTLVDLWRLNANGTIDASLNGTGKFRFILPQNIAGLGSSLASIHELADGRIEAFIAGYGGGVALRFWP